MGEIVGANIIERTRILQRGPGFWMNGKKGAFLHGLATKPDCEAGKNPKECNRLSQLYSLSPNFDLKAYP
jgi:hypothetical protein